MESTWWWRHDDRGLFSGRSPVKQTQKKSSIECNIHVDSFYFIELQLFKGKLHPKRGSFGCAHIQWRANVHLISFLAFHSHHPSKIPLPVNYPLVCETSCWYKCEMSSIVLANAAITVAIFKNHAVSGKDDVSSWTLRSLCLLIACINWLKS